MGGQPFSLRKLILCLLPHLVVPQTVPQLQAILNPNNEDRAFTSPSALSQAVVPFSTATVPGSQVIVQPAPSPVLSNQIPASSFAGHC